MPRPRKPRFVCSHPKCTNFSPQDTCEHTINMAIDEYEVIRLIDFEGLTQEECSEQMEVARTTVQSIYAAARKKLAECIVLGQHLVIGGGDVRFCEHGKRPCGKTCCRKIKRP